MKKVIAIVVGNILGVFLGIGLQALIFGFGNEPSMTVYDAYMLVFYFVIPITSLIFVLVFWIIVINYVSSIYTVGIAAMLYSFAVINLQSVFDQIHHLGFAGIFIWSILLALTANVILRRYFITEKTSIDKQINGLSALL